MAQQPWPAGVMIGEGNGRLAAAAAPAAYECAPDRILLLNAVGLLIAMVTGIVVTLVLGTARITQLHRLARRRRD